MEYLSTNSSELIIWLGALVVLISAMSRFNNPQILLKESSSSHTNWLELLKHSLSLNPGQQNLLLRPPRANTTIFRYRLYQFLYALLAVLVYLVMFMPGISEQIQVIILWFVPENMPNLINAGPLVIAAFVILILPNVPPFRWADINIRSMLYDRALIPAQQIREMHRLKIASYNPPANLVEQVREIAVTEGFDASDIAYDNQCPTTHSLWCKCVILMKQIKSWEADDHYKTAFAVLKEPDSERRSVDVVKEMQQNLMADARVCFTELRMDRDEKSEELINRETVFRSNCRTLLEKVYSLLAGVSLHSHYSDHDRIIQFGKLGFHLKSEPNGPIPDSNDMLLLTIILCTFLVLPLSYKLGPVKAVMIGAIMFSAVLTPVVLARLCPRMCDSKHQHHGPNVIYPLLSGVLAAFLGFLIFYIGGQFIEPSAYCSDTGYERYTNCSYPWSFLHGGIAVLLAIRLGTGEYPDVNLLQGMQRYRQWGDFKDAIICALGMLIITIVIVIPELDSLRPSGFEVRTNWAMPLRITLVAFVLGFIVPTWYRAQNQLFKINRRKDFNERERFKHELELKRHGMREG